MVLEEMRRLRRRVVVTGWGAITPLGLTVEDTWAAMLAGRSGIPACLLRWSAPRPSTCAHRPARHCPARNCIPS